MKLRTVSAIAVAAVLIAFARLSDAADVPASLVLTSDQQNLIGGTSTQIHAQVATATGGPADGVTVTFRVTTPCGTFGSSAASTVSQTTTQGVASVTFTAAATASGFCDIQVSAGTPPGLLRGIDVSVYPPSSISLVPVPSSVTVNAGGQFSVTINVLAFGLSILGVPIAFTANCPTAACVASLDPLATADFGHPATANAIAGAIAGQYSIVATTGPVHVTIPVTQVVIPPPPSVGAITVTSGAGQVIANSPEIPIPVPFAVRLTNPSGAPASGVTVTFTAPAGCGKFNGTTSLDVTTGPTGEASTSNFYGGPLVGPCNIQVTVPRTTVATSIPVVIYALSDVRVTATPASVTALFGQTFTVSLDVQVNGVPLPQFPLFYQVLILTARPSDVPNVPIRMVTSSSGRATLTVTAGLLPGEYQLIVSFGDSSIVIPVVQQQFPGPQPVPTMRLLSPALQTARNDSILHAPAIVQLLDERGAPMANTLVTISGGGGGNCGLFTNVSMPFLMPFTISTDSSGTASTPPFRASAPDFNPTPLCFFAASAGQLSVQFEIQISPTAAIQVQDMWWSGPAEDGWGMSVIQHGDVLFAVIYAYDVDGKPTWYTLSGGTWDPTHRTYTGQLYAPRGAPFFSYDASRFAAGSPVGTAALSFQDEVVGFLDYSVNGASGRKVISRQPLGATTGLDGRPHADMWWGGSTQDGWGIAVLQQYQSLFSVWFTYDSTGARTWFVMPGGTWTSDITYEGHIYSTTGSPWAGRTYDVSKFKVHDAGTYRLRFSGASATLDYVIDGRAGTLSLEKQPF